MAEALPDPFCGLILADKYEVQEMLAEGGMGRVYRGVHRLLDRAVAVKFIQPELASYQPVVERFMTEARTASRLSHPNVVKVYDFGATDTPHGRALYLVMELLKGIDLATVLERQPELGVGRVVDIVVQVLAALSEAHELGIVHRDIKPENVVLEPTRRGGELVKVIDFGVAAATAARRLTMQGQAVGTPDYMAPEQALGKQPTPQTDLYAAGVLLFRLLTGRTPFEGGPAEVMTQHLTAPRPDPAQWAAELKIPPALCEVWARAMRIEAGERHASAKEMMEALEDSVRVQPAPTSAPAPATAPRSDPAAKLPPARAERSSPPRAQPATQPAPRAELPSSPHDDRSPARVESPANRDEPRTARRADPPLSREEPSEALPSGSPAPREPRPARRGDAPLSREEPPEAPSSDVPRREEPARAGRVAVNREEPAIARRVDSPRAREEAPAARRVDAAPAREEAPAPTATAARNWTLAERSGALAWAEALVREARGVQALVYHGPEGSGRTRALSEVAALCARAGSRLVRVSARPSPLAEAGFGTLRDLLAALADRTELDQADAVGALSRAVTAAVSRPPAQRLVLMIDDIDLCDRASRRAIAGFVNALRDDRVLVLATSALPQAWDTERSRFQPLSGLSRAVAAQLIGERRLPQGVEEFTPLYLEVLDRFGDREGPPLELPALVDRGLGALAPEARAVLEAISVAGALSRAALAAICQRDEADVAAAAGKLVDQGWLIDERAMLRPSHAVFAREACTRAPRDVLHRLHGRLAQLRHDDGDLEVYVHHALRATPEFDAFLSAEEAARLRRARGDTDGEIALLSDAVAAARGHLLTDWDVASSAWIVLGDKLATRLMEVARVQEAEAVLAEAIDCCGQREDAGITRLMELAAEVASRRGKNEDAARWRDRAASSKRIGKRDRG